MAVGPYTRAIPKRPTLPSKDVENFMLAFPNVASRTASKIHYFICADQRDFK